MELLEHNVACISQPICSNKLIVSKQTVFFLLFVNISVNAIISENLIFCDIVLSRLLFGNDSEDDSKWTQCEQSSLKQ